jgi:cellulose synthase operon protein YhjQ
MDQNNIPEDVATLYSWANLHGAKYWDFSAARAQSREVARLRLQETTEAELRRVRDEEKVQRFAQEQRLPAAEFAAPTASGQAAPPPRNAPVQTNAAGSAQPAPWLSQGAAEPSGGPAPHALKDTPQDSRDRSTSRWFALQNVFEGAPAQETFSPPAALHVPAIAFFSLAGGVGKSSIVATLGRALSARGERVLLVDTAAYGVLPYFFGSRDQRPGVLRTFRAPGDGNDAPVQMLAVDLEATVSESASPEPASQDKMLQEIARQSHGVSRVLIDLATGSGELLQRILPVSPTVLVPVVPDMNSVVSVSMIDAFFQRTGSASGSKVLPYYILNRFDPLFPLHLDLREVLRKRLGDRLLPFALRRAPAVSEALAEGMTVIDYAPNSTAAEDFASLAGWVKSLAEPADAGYRGVRWSER